MLDPESLTLVAITDGAQRGTGDIVQRALACVRGGATMVQLRLKDADARTQVEVARALVAALPPGVPVIVNDRADLAIASGAAGVHVGPEDLPVAAVRRILGPDRIVGLSVGNDAEALEASGADYVGIGPVYATASKGDARGGGGRHRCVERRGGDRRGRARSGGDPRAVQRERSRGGCAVAPFRHRKVMSGAPTAVAASRRSGCAI